MSEQITEFPLSDSLNSHADDWYRPSRMDGEDTIVFLYGDGGHRLSVLKRMTGFGYRDTETGYKRPDGEFWLASGDFDIRQYGNLTIAEAIDAVKENANTCIGNEYPEPPDAA